MIPENSSAVKRTLEQLRLPEFNLEDEDIKKLAYDLKSENEFALASRLLGRLSKKNPKNIRYAQEWALCTYKNANELTEVRLNKAIDILKNAEGSLKEIENLETLGLLGSIYKKKWLHDNQIRNLRSSRYYYHRAYSNWIEVKEKQKKEGIAIDVLNQDRNVDDNGFNAINTIYLTDLLAYLEILESQNNEDWEMERVAKERLVEANTMRVQLIEHLPEIERLTKIALVDASGSEQLSLNSKLYWLFATLAEAHFGLHEFDKAGEYLAKAKAINGEDSWEYESFARQLAILTQVHTEIYGNESELIEAEAKKALKILLNKDSAIDAIFIGKVGLALSGGGFRASLFHIGVLARLAEENVLRHIEVLSCVSGGSIIGAYYYLEVKKLLENNNDEIITQKDYIDLVKRIESQFLTAIQNNLRTRIFGRVGSVFKLLFSGQYSTSERLAELYEKYLYRPLLEKSKQSLKMKDLRINVADDPTFNFKHDNWKRRNKVPNLVINATPLNTGHNWQFTASWMGEPPGSIIPEVDAKPRLRRMYYEEAPGKHQDMRLGQTVAASSGVPGVIEPLELDHLYKKDVKVQLVDGGVHDNQGIVGLLAQECQVFFVSDASGQLNVKNKRLGTIFGILTRSNSIMMERIRECEYLDLKSRLESNLIKGMMFVHLRKELEEKPLGWINSEEIPEEEAESKVTTYGINKNLQRLLASVRTDLDSFNDREAYALMYSGYRMTESEHQSSMSSVFKKSNIMKGNWDFLSVANELSTENPSTSIVQQLTISQQTFNKGLGFFPMWRKGLKWSFLFTSLSLLSALLYNFSSEIVQKIIPFLGITILIILLLMVVPFFLEKVLHLVGIKINTKFFRVVLTIVGVFLFIANRMGFNWLYLQKGKVKK